MPAPGGAFKDTSIEGRENRSISIDDSGLRQDFMRESRKIAIPLPIA